LATDGIKVFNFHPAHIFLNTENSNRWTLAKKVYKEYDLYKHHVNNKRFGTKDFLHELIDKAITQGFEFLRIQDIQCWEGCYSL
jgi:hypothetical protein